MAATEERYDERAAAAAAAAVNDDDDEGPKELPASFLRFVAENDLDPANFTAPHALPRFIRINPRRRIDVSQVEAQLGHKLEPVSWLADFYTLPSTVNIAGSEAYKSGSIYGVDAASGAAAFALDPQPGDHVLDICCAPGAKLCMIADRVYSDNEEETGFVTGVDISESRLATCRNVAAKYGVTNMDLWLGDAREFDRVELYKLGELKATTKLKEKKRARHKGLEPQGPYACLWSAPRRGKWAATPHYTPAAYEEGGGGGGGGDEMGGAASSSSSKVGYDRVLVDAECTHDGSIKHIAKFDSWGWDSFERRVLDADRMRNLDALQKGLLRNGFKMVRPGGVCVYSTCSMTKGQNEDVIEWLLHVEPSARLVAVPNVEQLPCRPGSIEHTIRFDPVTSGTSALFIARIAKCEE